LHLSINDGGTQGTEGITPLHDAALNGHLEVCKLLVEAGANMGVKDATVGLPAFF
jgi:ankyrin repeat protein